MRSVAGFISLVVVALLALAAASAVVAAPPVAQNATLSTKVNTPASVFPEFSDPDGDPVAITGVTDPANGTVVCDAVSCDYTPDDGYVGADSFDYTVTAGTETATATVSVEVNANRPPAAPDVSVTTRVGATVQLFPDVTDPDSDDVTLTGNTDPPNGTAACSGIVCTYTPDSGFTGIDTFDYTASDGTETGTGTVTVTVVGAPVNDVVVTLSGASVTFDVLANDGVTGAVTGTSAPAHGTAACQADGSCTYTPAAGFSGGDHFTYTVTGGDSATVWLRVDAPATSAPGGPVVLAGIDAEDGGIGGHGPVAVYIDLANSILARVDNGGSGILVVGGARPGCAGGQVEAWWRALAAGTGRPVTFVDAGAVATTNIGGFALVGVASSSAETFCGLTNEENAALALRRSDLKAFVNGGGGLLGLSQTGLAEPYAYMAELGAFRAVLGLEFNDISPTADGLLVGITDALDVDHWHDVYVEFPDWVGVLATDAATGDAAAVGGTSVVIDNQPPTAANGTVTTAQDVPASFALSGSDPEGGALGFSLVTQPAHGSVDCSPAGACAYTPQAGYTGPDSFTFRASDGVLDSNVATISITVEAVATNAPPVAVDDELATTEDTPGSVDVLANDSDPDGDPLTLTASMGSAVCTAAGECTYTPAPGFAGSDSFTYEVSDGRGGTDTATVLVTVADVNAPPVAVDDELTTEQDTPGTVGVLANDSDADGDPLAVTASTGTAQCTAAGECTYTPAPGFSGSDSFTYTVSDGRGGEDTATVTVTVEPVLAGNRPPEAVDDTLTTMQGAPGSMNVLANDSDPDGDPLTLAVSTGTAVCAAAGDCTYTPAPGFSGTDSFTYEVSDGRGGTDSATVAVTVQPAVADTKRPTCKFTGSESIGGDEYFKFTVGDAGSGLATIEVITSENATVTLPSFSPGTTESLIVRARWLNTSQSANVVLRATDLAGNVATCDPVFATLEVTKKTKCGVLELRDLPPAEHKITITNGEPALRKIRIAVNGRHWKTVRLEPGETVELDASAVMRRARNTVIFRGYGRKGANAFIVISD